MLLKTIFCLAVVAFAALNKISAAEAAELFQQKFVPASALKAPLENEALTVPELTVTAETQASMTPEGQSVALPPDSAANLAAVGIEWPSTDRDFRSLNYEQRRVVWKEISELRRDREQPTERGPWFTIHSAEDRLARTASDAQYSVIAAQALSMMQQGRDGQQDAARGAKAVIATGAATILIKKTMRRRRPYPNDHKFGSFPSGHTSTVFAMAAVFSGAQPQQRAMALGAAGLVGWSRVKVRAHHWDDVLIGGAMGYLIGRHFAPDNPSPRRQNYPVASIRFTF